MSNFDLKLLEKQKTKIFKRQKNEISKMYLQASKEMQKEYMKYKNMNTKILEDFFADNYFININAYSGLRYLRNNLILLCDWHCYVDPHNNDASEVYSNCLIQRLELFQSFMLN